MPYKDQSAAPFVDHLLNFDRSQNSSNTFSPFEQLGDYGIRQSPFLPSRQIFRPRQTDVFGIGTCPEPANYLHQILFCHGRTPCRRTLGPAPNVEEDGAAKPGYRRISVMPDFNQPAVRKVSSAHFLFLKPRRRITQVNSHMLVVIAAVYVVDPSIPFPDRVKWIVGTRW